MRFITLIVLFLSLSLNAFSLPSLNAPQHKHKAMEETIVSENAEMGDYVFNYQHSWVGLAKKEILKWQIFINRQVPKEMKKLKDEASTFIIFNALLLAFLYGAFHTLGPGHGKMVVASYFLSQPKANWARGVFIGLQVAFSHVLSAVALVLFTNIAMKEILTNPESQVFTLKIFSYSLILVIGVYMFYQSLVHIKEKSQHSHSCNHCKKVEAKVALGQESALAWSIGLVPCTGSLLILLYAMANDMLMLGLAMVLAVAVGMAITMIIIGWLCILGRKTLVEKYTNTAKGHKIKTAIELIGSLFILTFAFILMLSLINFS